MSDANQTPQQPEGGAKPSRLRRSLLIGSLALNLLVITAIATAVISGGPHRSGPPRERDLSAPYIGAFTISDKRAIRKQMRGQLQSREEMKAQIRADYEAFLAIVRTEPFDADAAVAAIERQMARSGDVQRLGRRISVERIGQMDAAGREAYAQRFEEFVRKGGRRGDTYKDGKDRRD